MDQKTKTTVTSLLVSMFVFSALIGTGYALYKERRRLKGIAKQYALVFKSQVKASDLRVRSDIFPRDLIDIEVDAAKKGAKIHPNIYGSNLLPYSESEYDIMNFIRSSGFTIFRFPGGTSPGFHWKTGQSDFTDRTDKTPLSQMDYLIKFCKLTNTRLLIQVNVESGTPEEAAGWVEYMNQKADFPVTYWQIGNEVFGDWDRGFMTAAQYAQTIQEYAKAMKAVDPSIKIGMNWAPSTHNERFNIEVMKRAAEDIDFVTYHWYPNHVDYGHLNKEKQIHPDPKNVMANALQVPEIVDRVYEIGEKFGKTRENLEVTFTEWDGAWDAPNFDYAPYSEGIAVWSLANAIFHAETLAQFAYAGVTVANQYVFQDINFGNIRGWDREGGWGGSRWNGESVRPKAYAMQLMANHFRGTTIEAKVNNSPKYFKIADWWPDSYAGLVPYVTSYASVNEDENYCTVVLINKHPEKDFVVTLALSNIIPEKTADLYVLSGPNLMASNERDPQTVKISSFNLNINDASFKYKLPARSVNVMRFVLEGS